jgi:hypothetical protein
VFFFTRKVDTDTLLVISINIVEQIKGQADISHEYGMIMAPLFLIEQKGPIPVIVYRERLNRIFDLNREDFETESIPGFSLAPFLLNYIFKHVKDSKHVKKMKSLSFFLPELALVSSNDEIPGLINAKFMVRPLETSGPIVLASKFTLYLYRLRFFINNFTEQ